MNFKPNFDLNKNLDLKLLNLLFFIVGVSIPFSYAFNSISIFALFLYSFKWADRQNYLSLFKKGFYPPLLFVYFFIIQFIGIFYSDNLNIGISYVIQNIVFLILPITFVNILKILDGKKVKLAVTGLVVGLLTILLSIHINILQKIFSDENLGIISLITYFVRVEFVQEGLVEIHPPYFGLLTVFSIVAVFKSDFLSKKNILNIFIKYIIILYLIISLYGISSFMAIILLIALFVIYTLLLFRKRKFKSILIIFTSILILSVFLININYRGILASFRGESLLGRVEWSFFQGKGDTSRPENWKSVAIVIKEKILVGVGSDGGINYLQKHRNTTSESFREKHNAHNQYLEVLLRHGIFGLSLYLIILYYLITTAIKSRDMVFCWFLFVFIISSITESYLVRQIGIIFFAFYALLFSMFYNTNKRGVNQKSINKSKM